MVGVNHWNTTALSASFLLLALLIECMQPRAAFGASILKPVSSKYVAEHPEEFKVETAVHQGTVDFTFSRVENGQHRWSGQIVIRQKDNIVVSCELRSSGGSHGVSYSFAVSEAFLDNSEFYLLEYNKPKPGQVPDVGGGMRYAFRLQDFVGAAKAK